MTLAPPTLPPPVACHENRTAKGGRHGNRSRSGSSSWWCPPSLLSQARVAMWLIWDTILALLRPLTALVGGGPASIALDKGTR